MPRYRIDYYAHAAAESDAVQASSRIETVLASRTDYVSVHGPAVYQDADLAHTPWVASGGGWFTTRASAEQVRDVINDRLNSGPGSNRILAGSWVELHECYDADGQGCDPDSVEYIRKT